MEYLAGRKKQSNQVRRRDEVTALDVSSVMLLAQCVLVEHKRPPSTGLELRRTIENGIVAA